VMAAIAAGRDDSGEASLVSLIQAGDKLNHAILDHGEVQQAVRRLRNTGLLTVSDTGFVLTEAGGQLAEEAGRRGGGLAVVDRLLKALGRQPVVDSPPWLLSESAHDEACRTYMRIS
jgi:hypothetical protein